MSTVFQPAVLDEEQQLAVDGLRNDLESLVIFMTAVVPASAERTIAFRHLEEAGFFAIKAISRRGEKYLP